MAVSVAVSVEVCAAVDVAGVVVVRGRVWWLVWLWGCLRGCIVLRESIHFLVHDAQHCHNDKL